MARSLLTLAVAAGALAALANAQPTSPAGTWKFAITVRGFSGGVLLKLEETGGQWVGKVLALSEMLDSPPAVEGVTVIGDRLRFVLQVAGQSVVFDGRLPAKAGGKIRGSMATPGAPASEA